MPSEIVYQDGARRFVHCSDPYMHSGDRFVLESAVTDAMGDTGWRTERTWLKDMTDDTYCTLSALVTKINQVKMQEDFAKGLLVQGKARIEELEARVKELEARLAPPSTGVEPVEQLLHPETDSIPF